MVNTVESKNTDKISNRLIHEKSPYLLQHAHNPVDWYSWGDDAFEKALRENKPIFLSIGYSTCHWCHVMAHESFEDAEVARLMNDAFISIKVDREERPDLDHVYMTVCQMLTGGGGWPLTVLMDPDKKPFFATTYIPKKSRWGRPGMMELIPHIKTVWQTRREELRKSAEKIIDALESMEKEDSRASLGRQDLDRAYEELRHRFDEKYGGFSKSPKFPTPHNLLFLLRYWKRSGDEHALYMTEKTLQAMRMGGIYDHIGFGFHRYSTDQRWLLPHFEKMLYDQALVALVYLEAYQATGKARYGQTAREIFTYVLRDMTSPEGGFYSAEDADSEGVEGKFYVWDETEIRGILDKDEADVMIRLLNVETNGNFREEATGHSTGTNILHLKKPLKAHAEDLHLSVGELESRVESSRKKLFDVREKRIHPHKDDKILTDWNGLMIAALARGAQVLGEPRFSDAAEKAGQFILNHLRDSNGRLLHRYREGDSSIVANLDDYAFFAWGLIELYEATFNTNYLQAAIHITRDMLTHFWDHKNGGFFFTPADGEKLIVRKKEVYDGAIPSGNAVAMSNLLRIARFTGQVDLDEAAEKTGRTFSGQIKAFPSGYTQFLTAVDFGIGPSFEIVITGPTQGKDTMAMLASLRKTFIPNRVILFRPSEKKSPEIDTIARFIGKHDVIDGQATAYVCRNHFCKMPTTRVDELLEMVQ